MGVAHAVEKFLNLFAADAGQIVANAKIENGFPGRTQECVASEQRIAAEHFNQHGPGNIFAERIFDEQFLRPFDVVADVGHVNARPANGQAVVHLHRFEFQDARTGDITEQNVLGHLRVRPSSRSSGVAQPACRGKRTVKSCLLSAAGIYQWRRGSANQRLLRLRLQIKPTDKIGKRCGDEFSH